MSPLDKVAKRYKITAREARDIATAVGTVATIGGAPRKEKIKAVKNVGKQVADTARAAAMGKKGGRSARTFVVSSESGASKYKKVLTPKELKAMKAKRK